MNSTRVPPSPPEIALTREVRFSVDRDWAGRIDPARPVTNSWGGWPSAVGLVPFLRLRATVRGRPDPVTGYVCNIAQVDRLLREHAVPAAAEALARRGWRLAVERLVPRLFRRIEPQAPCGTVLDQLELLATPFLRYAATREAPDMVFVTQQFEFSAAHRLHSPQLSDEENRSVFGKCNNPHGHGHNYVLDVTIAVPADGSGGAALPLPRFEGIVRERVIDAFDHKHLNEDVAQFRALNPSVENLARVTWDLLAEALAPARLHAVRVYETPKTWAEYFGPARRG